MTVFGFLSALFLGAAYGYAITYIPFIYLNFFITIGLGLFVGFAVGFGGKMGKARNCILLSLFALISGILALYVGWVSWFHASSEQGLLIVHPSDIIEMLKILAQTGVWSIHGDTPKGWFLYSIWAIEALMIVGISTTTAGGFLMGEPFCERCMKWVDEHKTVSPLNAIENAEAFIAQLEQDVIANMSTIKKLEYLEPAYTNVKLSKCPACQQQCFLSVGSVVVTKNSKGEEEAKEKKIVENLILTPDELQKLENHWEEQHSADESSP